MFKPIAVLPYAICLCCETAFATSTVSAIGPFTGEFSEGFELFRPGDIPGPERNLSGPVEILAGRAALSGVHSGPVRPLYVWDSFGGFSLGQNLSAVPFDGTRGLHLQTALQDPLARVDFHTPVSEFGGYWVHAVTQTRGGPVTVTFYDGGGTTIGTERFNYDVANLQGVSHWFGWSSTIPIHSLSFTGFFAGIDGIQINVIPEPATMLMALIASLALLSGRQART